MTRDEKLKQALEYVTTKTWDSMFVGTGPVQLAEALRIVIEVMMEDSKE